MKKIIYFLIFIPFISIAQVGIGTTDPRTTLDVNGAITNREISFAVASNAVTIATETSLANITGSATATIAVTSFTPTVNGCRLIISNNTTGGFGATFAGMTIPNSQAIEFVYTNGLWKTTAGGTGAANNIYNSNGTLSGNRTVTQGASSLTFTGTGNTILNSGNVGVGTATPLGKLNVSGGLVIGSGTGGGNTTGVPFSYGNTTNSAIWFGNYDNTAASDYGVMYLQGTGDTSTLNILTGDNASGAASDESVFIGNVEFTSGTKKGMTIKNGFAGIGTTAPTAQLHTTGSVLFAGAGTPTLGRSLVTDATGLATWQNPLASNSTSTAIAASATQVAVPSTNVQGAISDLASAIRTAQNSTIYTSDGTLTGNRTVTQGANTLTFNSTAVNGFSVDGTTFSVDGANDRIGIGTTNPTKKLTVENGSIRPAIGNTDDSGISFPTNIGGGGGDEAFIRYYVESGENTKLMIGVNNDVDDDISFYQGGAERMNIYNGNVGIGTTTPVAKLDLTGLKATGSGTGTGGSNDNPSQAIIPAGNNGTSRFNDWPAGWGGGISTYDIVGGSTFMNANLIRSDFRLKNDIKNIDNSIFSNFMKIRPVTYFMKEQTKEMEGLQYGFIAQEIRDLFPSMVTKSTDPNGIIGMNYQALISPTIYVVQQQQAKIDELQKQVDTQNEKLSKMEEELKQI